MRRWKTTLPARLFLALATCAGVLGTAASAHAYDDLPGVPLAGDVPWTSAAVFDFTTPVFSTADFDVEPLEAGPEESLSTRFLGCQAWGARTAWVRFSTAVSGRAGIAVDSSIAPGPSYDVFYKTYHAAARSASYPDLVDIGCHNSNTGPDEAYFFENGSQVPAGRTLYIQILVFCAARTTADPCDAAERQAAQGGPTTVRLRFVPDNADGDAVPDTLDRCPYARGPAGALRGCPDSDGDGIADVDDRCPGVKGTDARGCDADGDGHVGRAHGGDDCDDGNAAVRPGALDVPGNGIDEDCDGRDARHPRLRNELAALAIWSPKLRRHVGFAGPFSVGGPLVKGMTVRLRCQGRGCPFSSQAVVVRKRRATLKVGRALVGRRLAAGAKLTLLVLRPGHVGIGKRYVLRARRRAKVVDLCVPAGKTRPRRRCV